MLRDNLAYFTQVTAEIAIMALITLGPNNPAMAMARIKPGKATIISPILMMIVSTSPPKYPARIPKKFLKGNN